MGSDTKPYQIPLFDFCQNRSANRERERERERERGRLRHIFNSIISIENLLASWEEFLKGKRKRKDVVKFSINLISNVLEIHEQLSEKTYKHGVYCAFKINDPKPRDIHKASVGDRLIHHALYRILYPYFDKKFIFDSYSCRVNKGTHKALDRFRLFFQKASKNNTKTVWVLKCDIKKFFANIDHFVLKNILQENIYDMDVNWLLEQVIHSFNTAGQTGVGLPLGNLTSQLLVNIYMNKFDQFIKRKLKIKYYLRYADDFVIFHTDKQFLETLVPKISEFLKRELKLSLNMTKVFIKTAASGVDFLGWVHFPNCRILRTSTKKRMLKKLNQDNLSSYLGLLKHGNTHKIVEKITGSF